MVITWRVLKRVFELCEEILFFLNQQKNVSLAERFTQKKFVANIAYMSDIFHSLNCRNKYRFNPGPCLCNDHDWDHDWTINTFAAADLPELPLRLAEEFTDMIAEPLNRITFNSFKSKHPKVSENLFIWASMRSTYSIISAFVIKQLIPFATTWLCKAAFSAMSVLKMKYINRLGIEHNLRLFISKTAPRFQKLVDRKQPQSSH